MKLLLLDELAEAEQFTVEFAAHDGCQVLVANNLDSALTELGTSRVNAFILDRSALADPDRMREISRSCQIHRTLLLLIVDSAGDLLGLDDAAHLVADDFMIRPVIPEDVWARLNFLFRRRAQLFPTAVRLTALPGESFRVRRDGSFIEQHVAGGMRLSHIDEHLPDHIASRVIEAIEQALDMVTPRHLEYKMPLAGGVHSSEACIIPCADDQVLLIIRDLTERNQADARLSAAAEVKRAFASRVISVQESERHNLSRELHEKIGQMLLVHRMDVEWLVTQTQPGPARDAAEGMCTALDKTLESVRNLAMDLRPPAIDDLGVGSALEGLVANIARRSGVRCECEIDPQIAEVPADVSVAMYRIAQEALTNAIRHARCENIIVSLSRTDRDLELRILDDGVGFNPDSEEGSSWLGLMGMRERADLVRGTVSITSGPNQGTCIKVIVPGVLESVAE